MNENLKTVKVLLMEQDESLLTLFKKVVEYHNTKCVRRDRIELTATQSVEEATNAFVRARRGAESESPYNYVWVHGMLDSNAQELLKNIRNEEKSNKLGTQVPVGIITDSDLSRDMVSDMGFAGIIRMPLSMGSVLDFPKLILDNPAQQDIPQELRR